jgi:hypothetical protein
MALRRHGRVVVARTYTCDHCGMHSLRTVGYILPAAEYVGAISPRVANGSH